MNLKEIASIAGKPGLFKIIKPTRNGIVIESLDEKKIRSIASGTSRVSVLKDVSIYTSDAEGTAPLGKVLKAMYEASADALPIDGRGSQEELLAFMETVLPEYDRKKVYASDVKKIIAWYALLLKYAEDVLKNLGNEETQDAEKVEEAEENKA